MCFPINNNNNPIRWTSFTCKVFLIRHYRDPFLSRNIKGIVTENSWPVKSDSNSPFREVPEPPGLSDAVERLMGVRKRNSGEKWMTTPCISWTWYFSFGMSSGHTSYTDWRALWVTFFFARIFSRFLPLWKMIDLQ